MFRVTARTVLELGSELISSDVIAFYELIKNGFDARTKNGVEVRFDVVLGLRSYSSLRNRSKEREVPLQNLKERCLSELNSAATTIYDQARKLIVAADSYDQLSKALNDVYSLNTIRVIDTGTGMSATDLEEKFLVIGTPSRKIAVEKSVAEGQKKPDFLGEKGLGPFTFEAHWYNRRRVKAEGGMDREQILKLHRQWTGIRMYRDDFRVYPYGQEKDDWLGLDREALMARGYLLNKIQLVGQVDISRSANPGLVDQTNREGLRETHEQQAMLRIVQFSIQDQLRNAMKRAETKYKPKRAKPVEAKTEIARLETRAQKAISSLRSVTTNQERETIEELQQTLLELTELAKVLRERNAEVEGDAKLMQDMAGIGLLVEIVAHELARTSEHALERIREIRSTATSDEVVTGLDGLAASMKSIHKRLRILDPLSVSGRQAPETFSLTQIISETLEDHQTQFNRHGIHLNYEPPRDRFTTKTVKGYVVQIFENLLANSVYWLSLEKEKSPLF